MSKRVLVILHEGFEEIEAVTPIDILRRGGVDVLLASQTGTLSITGRNGMRLQAETSLEAVAGDNFDAIVLPGGPGILNAVRGDARVESLLKTHLTAGKLTAAICAAPLVLNDAGLLTGKRYTAHFSATDELPAIDATQAVVEDGPLLTSRGAGTATAFGLAILTRLTDQATSQAVAESICLMSPQ